MSQDPTRESLKKALDALQQGRLTTHEFMDTLSVWVEGSPRTLEALLGETRPAPDLQRTPRPSSSPVTQGPLASTEPAPGDEPTRLAQDHTFSPQTISSAPLGEALDSSSTRPTVLRETPHHTPIGAPSQLPGRFQNLRDFKQGGMGVVNLGIDLELQREVALKELKPQFANDPSARHRFVQEAVVTGRLEHPGVVPVYGLGWTRQNQPFYAMKLIRGNTLEQESETLHDPSAPEDQFAPRLRKLLRRFVDTCQVVQYAHSRHVIHRDIKPSNILLGPYGETLLVDWGLAKVLGQTEDGTARTRTSFPTQTSPVAEFSSDLEPSTETRAGMILGTPGYLSPEQAAGQSEEIGPASDIYSLGATLYHILAGQASIRGGSLEECLAKVLTGAVQPARAANPRVPPALEAVCSRAMSLKPEDRYASALELAEDIERYLADDPVAAYQEPWTARLARWARRHLAGLSAAAALLLTAIIALAAGYLLLQKEKDRTELKRQEAEQSFLLARAAVDELYTRVHDDRRLKLPNMEPLRRELLESTRRFFDRFVELRKQDPDLRLELGRAIRQLATINHDMGSAQEALAQAREAVQILNSLLQRQPSNHQLDLELARAYAALSPIELSAGNSKEAAEASNRALELLTKAHEQEPQSIPNRQELASSLIERGGRFLDSERFQEAQADLEKALALRAELAKESPQDTRLRRDHAVGLYNVGLLQARMGRAEESLETLDQSINLLQSLLDQEKTTDTIDFLPDLASACNTQGALYSRLGRRADALQAFNKAIQYQEQLVRDHPELVDFQLDLARSLGNLSLVLKADPRQIEQAVAASSRAAEVLDALARLLPDDPDVSLELARALVNLVQHLIDQQDWTAAQRNLERASLMMERLLELVPDHELAQNVHLATLESLAELYLDQDQPEKALEIWTRALSASDSNHNQNENRRRLLLGRATALARAGRFEEAIRDTDNALEDPNASALEHYSAACVHALIAQHDPASPQADRSRDKAMRLLEEARSAGFFNKPSEAERLLSDPDLDALRDLPEFQLFVESLRTPEPSF